MDNIKGKLELDYKEITTNKDYIYNCAVAYMYSRYYYYLSVYQTDKDYNERIRAIEEFTNKTFEEGIENLLFAREDLKDNEGNYPTDNIEMQVNYLIFRAEEDLNFNENVTLRDLYYQDDDK